MSGDADGRIFFETNRRLLRISVIENDCDTCFSDTSLATFIDEVLTSLLVFYSFPCIRHAAYRQVLSPNCRHVRDAKHETDGVQNVGLPAAVEAGDRVEALVPFSH